jgi:hypothetical protein
MSTPAGSPAGVAASVAARPRAKLVGMPDDERPSLEAPQLFGRRRAKRAEQAKRVNPAAAPVVPAADRTADRTDDRTDDTASAGDEQVFQDSGLDIIEAPVDTPTDRAADRAGTGGDGSTATSVLPAQPAEAAPSRGARPDRGLRLPGRRTEQGGTVDVAPAPVATPAEPRRTVRDRTTPLLPGRPAAVVAGLAAGLALLGFTWLGFRGCEAVRGTTSCGTAPGMAALVVIFVLAVVVGGVLLSRFGVPDPGATSFLGTGLTGVVYLLFVDYLDNWTVLVVVPVVTALTFLLSWWVTTTYVDTD